MKNWIEALVMAGVIYLAWRFKYFRSGHRWQKSRSNIYQHKVIAQWSSMIEKARGKGDALLEKVARLIKENNIPNISLTKRMVSVDGAKPLPFLIASNAKAEGYDMYIGAFDYADRLNVLWYVTWETSSSLEDNRLKKSGKEGFENEYSLTMLDRQEITNCTTIIHDLLMEEVKQMMSGLNLDFTKIDTHTRGLLNIA